MNYCIHILAVGSAMGLTACAPHIHTLVPEKASAGRLQHSIDGDGKLEVSYSGKTYSGEFEVKSSRRIQGEHQRWPGSIARSTLVEPDGDKLICDVQWPSAGHPPPAGVCKDKTGASFAVRFD